MSFVRPPTTPSAGPAARAAFFFAAGIIVSAWITPSAAVTAAALICAIPASLFLRRKDAGGDIAAAFALVFAGMFVHSASNGIRAPFSPPPEFARGTMTITGVLAGEPRNHSGYASFTLACRIAVKDGRSYRIAGSLPCILPRREIMAAEGTEVMVKGMLRPLPHPFEPSIPFRRADARRTAYRLTVFSSPDGFATIGESGSFFGNARTGLAELTSRYGFDGHRDLLLAMTIGYLRDLSTDTRETFTRAGIAHILAVSGMNVGVVAAAAFFLLGLLPIGKKPRFAAAGAAIIIYAGLCGFQPPIARALVMALALMGAYFLERPNRAENSLFAAFILIAAVDPDALFGASLQLSFAAAWSLAVLYPGAMERIGANRLRSRLLRYTAGLLTATALASAVTAPITASHFGLMPLLSLPSNLIAVPLASLVTIAGMLFFAAATPGAILAPIAASISAATGLLLTLLVRVAETAAALPLASVEPGHMPPLLVPAAAAWLFLFPRRTACPAFMKALVYIPLAAAAVWAWAPVEGLLVGRGSSAVFFDVGQGDAALLSHRGKRFLIDTGPSSPTRPVSEMVILPSLRSLGTDRLDCVFLSHMDDDHAGGLSSLDRVARIGRIFCRAAVSDSLERIFGSRVTGLAAGDSLSFDGGGALVLSSGDDMPGSQQGENEKSLVIRFTLGDRTLLFPGDIPGDIQRRLTAWGGRLRADILKTPHHGGRGLDPDFLLEARPRIAVVSCGLNNRFGHPSPETLSLLERAGARIERTDLDGHISVRMQDMGVERDGR